MTSDDATIEQVPTQVLGHEQATDSMAPASALGQSGIRPIGVRHYELGLEPILGVTALESVGMTIDPANQTRKRLPAIPLK